MENINDYIHFNKSTEIRQIAVALNICLFQQLSIFVSTNSHQLLTTHWRRDRSDVTKKSDVDFLFTSVTKSWHPTQFLSLQELKFKQKQKKRRYKFGCLSNPS